MRGYSIQSDYGHELWKNHLRNNIRLERWYDNDDEQDNNYEQEESHTDDDEIEEWNISEIDDEENEDQLEVIQEELSFCSIMNNLPDFHWDLKFETFNHLKHVDLELNIIEKKNM